MRYILQFVDKQPTPPLLPILRSQQQAEILVLLLGDPGQELSLTAIAERNAVPYPSVHREIERAEAAGLVTSRRVGNTRLVRANTDSPYFEGMADVLTKAFGVPSVLSDALAPVAGIAEAFIHGSWAARFSGLPGDRPVQDIDVLLLGSPDRDHVFAVLSGAEQRLGRQVQVTFRASDWLANGSGPFHATVAAGPLVPIEPRSE